MEFLEFEVPIKEILDKIDKCKSIENESVVDITKTYNLIQKKLVDTK
jgi:acetyl-CoA carboxylase carboxyl transferase subunit alpha